ncbi:MAG: hypothetical protein QNI87_08660 [Erythrobacter sp.]|uniref:hypothetical protein n=1 Tax=Erythrobacter sp. TaxID=1042 RepID=UPI00260C8BC6|nr:hypothetical protein [Erythrobacter sp.]MDJ0978595.1 hypothetical protein [Erythrobacter sp.]
MAWSCAAVMGVAAPVAAMLLIALGPFALSLASGIGPILAIGLMGTGMIAAAADGRFAMGVFLALAVGVGLLILAQALGLPALPYLPAIALVVAVATISFAARGALFARSMPGKGWGMAVFVVAGEAAIVLTALAHPGALPDWLLALLPAQWASSAIQEAFTGTGPFAAWAALLALGGTAAATLLVARLLPRRWPYLIMFTTWLTLSAVVYYNA